MSETMVIVGAGPIGRNVAQLLADRGDRVVLATRSGRGPDLPGVTRVAVDAADPDALTAVVTGARALFNCANPTDYTSWDRIWPPLAESFLQTAERTGATLVTASCLYGYGPTAAPMVAGHPIWPPITRVGCAPGCGRRPGAGTKPAGSPRSRCGDRTTSARGWAPTAT